MTEQERLLAALEYQEAQRPALMNPNLMRQGQRMNLPARQAPGPMAEFVTQAMSLDPQPDQGLGTMGVEMGLSLVPGVGQAMGLRDVERGRRANDPVMMGLGAASLIPVGKLIGALRGGKQMGPVSELDVYHGSPQRFPPTAKNPLGEFDATKIGTGEGAQAYGHGLYVAENPAVARDYQKNLGGGWRTAFNDEWATNLPQPAPLAGSMISKHNGNIKAAIADLRSSDVPAYKQAGDWLEKQHSAGAVQTKEIGSLYKVDLPDEQIAKMLDWDKPLSQSQRQSILKALPQELRDVEITIRGQHGSGISGGFEDLATTPDMVNALAKYMGGHDKASNFLQSIGIPGIKYLDQGSRVGGKGTSNFVVFPGGEKMLNILERQ